MDLRKEDKSYETDSGFEKLREVILSLLTEDMRHLIITPETSLEELGFDSISYMHLILSLQELVDRDIDEIMERVQLSSLVTINDVLSLIHTLKEK